MIERLVLGISCLIFGFWCFALNDFKIVEEKLVCSNQQAIENGICYGNIKVVEIENLTPIFLMIIGILSIILAILVWRYKNGKHRTNKQ